MVPLMLILTTGLLVVLGTLFVVDHKKWQAKSKRYIHGHSKPHNISSLPKKTFTISSKDIASVAGDDVLTAQLNLARAYLEAGRKALAINMLNNIMQHGNSEQKTESERLLSNLEV